MFKTTSRTNVAKAGDGTGDVVDGGKSIETPQTTPKPESKGNFFTQAGTTISNNPGRTALGLGAVGALGVGAYAFMGSNYHNGSVAGTGATGSTSGGAYGSGGAMGQGGSADLLTKAVTQGQSKSSDPTFYDRFNQRLLNDTAGFGSTVQNTSMTHNIPTGTVRQYNMTTTPSVSNNTTSTAKPETLQDLLG